MTKDEILAELPNFYGTQNYHRWSILFKTMVLSDGAHFIAEECGAYWLMDAIGSYLPKYRAEGFAEATLKVKKGKATLVIDDGNGKKLATQKIEFTDFPLDEIKFYVVRGEQWVIMLPSEY